ncbi:isoprenylcysteine carboxylmethyltransferase family protein [Paenibacillus sp. yr247]|uniref:methyltransferase family protein n=1 Tax=Paenibacillus sp. yr247 TaxID=1761880 RepID=UPI0026767DB0|nr:isoprenylcysteine carboxylmethyltransferase family protein [Paenibacillus sp. yr247]
MWLLNNFVPTVIWSLISYEQSWCWLRVLGIIFLITSSMFTLWARWVLGKMWTESAALNKGSELRTDGPYRVTRHPIYTGILGMLLGTTLMNGFGKLLLYFVIAVIILEIKIRAEEMLMIETFKDNYLKYKYKVPKLIPRILKGKKN